MEEIVIGIARKSRKTQNIQRQVRNILAQYPNARIVKITHCGATVIGYKEFQKVINEAKAGMGNKKYKLVFDSASRMSRDSEGGCNLYEDLFNHNVDIEFLKEPQINTAVYKKVRDNQINIQVSTGNKATDEFMNAIIEAINKYTIELAKEQIKKVFDQAQKELEDIHTRTAEGLVTAKEEGKRVGLPKGSKLTTKKEKKAKEVILKHSKTFNGTLSDTECIKLAGICRNSYYTYKKELVEEIKGIAV